MTHYTCLACKGVADNGGMCQTSSCSLQGKPLRECDCMDGQHAQTAEPEHDNSQRTAV